MNAPRESERGFMQAVIELARACSWLVYHTHDSRHSAAGFPDLVLAKPGQPIIFAELKREGEKPNEAQTEWLGSLAMSLSAVEVYVWWPSNWPQISQRLKGERR